MTKQFWKAAGIRALRTMAQAAVVLIPTGVAIQEIGWLHIAGLVAAEGVVSVLSSIATGLPEVEM